MFRLYWNLGASTCCNPQVLPRPVMEVLYLFTVCSWVYIEFLSPVSSSHIGWKWGTFLRKCVRYGNNAFLSHYSEMVRLEDGSVWCWNLEAPGNRSETPGKFWNVVLEKDGDQLDRSCEKWRRVLRVNEQRNILQELRKRKANWIGHILRRNCVLQQIIEGKIKEQIEVTRRRGRRHKKLLDDVKDRRGYCQLKEEALDRTMWRNRFGRGFGPVVWQITDVDDDDRFYGW